MNYIEVWKNWLAKSWNKHPRKLEDEILEEIRNQLRNYSFLFILE